MSSLACIIQLKGAFQTNHHLFTEKMYLFFIFLFHQTEFVYRTSRQNVRISRSDESVWDDKNRSSIKKNQDKTGKKIFQHVAASFAISSLSFSTVVLLVYYETIISGAAEKKRNEQPL